MGGIVSVDWSLGDPVYDDHVCKNYDLLTAESTCKWAKEGATYSYDVPQIVGFFPSSLRPPNSHFALGNLVVNTSTWLRECCRQVEAEVVSNSSSNKLHLTTYT